MAASTEDQRVHTYLDDIKFQTVKGDNKRTSFVSSDHLILSKKAQVIKNIEKTEKLANADFRRQQSALLKNLDRLQNKRENTIYFSEPHPDGGNIFGRRHSSPCLERTFVSCQNSTTSTSPTHAANLTNANVKRFPSKRVRKLSNASTSSHERKMSNSSEGGDSQGSRDSLPDDVTNTFSRQSSSLSHKMSLVEVRRMSHDIQAETSKMALEKLNQIVTGHKRRATIAEGAMPPSHLVPSSELLSRLSRADDYNSDADN